MKTIPLKIIVLDQKVKNEKGELEPVTITYLKQLKAIMKTPSNPQSGADYEEMRSSIRILDVLDKVDEKAESFDLEDADFKYMVGRVKGARFLTISKELLQFVDDVTIVK